MAEPGKYLDVAGAAAYLAISTSYLSKLVSRKKIPFIKLGRRVVFDRILLDRWAARRTCWPRDWGAGGTA